MTLLNPSDTPIGTAATVRAAAATVGRMAHTACANLQRRYREAQAIERIMEMDASRLKDLGISFGEIESAVRLGRAVRHISRTT